MAKDKGGKKRDNQASAMEGISAAMREAGARAAELAQNPVARSLLAAGLVTAAAALTSSKKVRANVQKASRDALDGAEAVADATTENANKIGAAIVSAATDAVRRMMDVSGIGKTEAPAAATAPEAPMAAPAGGTGASRAKPSSKAKSAAVDGGESGAKPRKAKAAKGNSKSTAAAPPKAASKTGAKPGRKKGAARDPGIGTNGS